MENQANNSGKSARAIFIAIIVLLLGLNGLLGYLYVQEKGKVEVQTVTIENLTQESADLEERAQFKVTGKE